MQSCGGVETLFIPDVGASVLKFFIRDGGWILTEGYGNGSGRFAFVQNLLDVYATLMG